MSTKNIGTVVQITGPVLDIRFPEENLPNLLNAITLEHNGQTYTAFFPAVEEGADEDDADYGLVILKTIVEDGEELLSTLDSDEELEEVYQLFSEQLFSEEDDEGADE